MKMLHVNVPVPLTHKVALSVKSGELVYDIFRSWLEDFSFPFRSNQLWLSTNVNAQATSTKDRGYFGENPKVGLHINSRLLLSKSSVFLTSTHRNPMLRNQHEPDSSEPVYASGHDLRGFQIS